LGEALRWRVAAKLGRARSLSSIAFLVFALSSLIAAPTFAEIVVSLPLAGHYRPGRYMPVEVSSRGGESGHFSLDASGAMPTQIPLSRDTDVIVPWLPIRTVDQIHWTIVGHSQGAVETALTPLGENECLVGYIGADADAVAALFPGKKIVGVALDPGKPLAGPAAAWETLDAAVLDASAAARINARQVESLLASGMALAVRSSQKPAGPWPWKQSGPYWVVQYPILGPQSAYAPQAYDAIAVWSRGWPGSFCNQVMLAAVVFSLLALVVTLWQSKAAAALMILLALGACGASLAWRASQDVGLHVGGTLYIDSSAGVQRDGWTFVAVMRSATVPLPWRGLAHPIFATRLQIQQMPVRLLCATGGSPDQFQYQLEPGRSLAFLSRSIASPNNLTAETPIVSSPLRSLAMNLYLTQGDTLVGQQAPTSDPDLWPAAIIGRRK
ncbi:MAG TPA: hypothetical protein VFW23_15425, partial [Tepidisphaeraceae bacterium]|nr:hypothetical protein [Tepidisphaeraceae bacterium]